PHRALEAAGERRARPHREGVDHVVGDLPRMSPPPGAGGMAGEAEDEVGRPGGEGGNGAGTGAVPEEDERKQAEPERGPAGEGRDELTPPVEGDVQDLEGAGLHGLPG